jgi:hypothetical protein
MIVRIVTSCIVAFAALTARDDSGKTASRTATAPANSAASSTTALSVEGRPDVLSRIVVIGASVSSGFEDMFSSLHPLKPFVAELLRCDASSIDSMVDPWFFSKALETGKAQSAYALSRKPTLLIATDYLFWFGYGKLATDADRLALLEKGLAELAKFECTVIVGDFPDGSPAIGKLLVKEQVPSKEMLQKLNARLREWAKERKNVAIIPLSELLPKLQARETIECRGNRWSGEKSLGLLGADSLHLTPEGTAALAILTMDAVARAAGLPADKWNWKSASIVEGVAKAAARPESRNK